MPAIITRLDVRSLGWFAPPDLPSADLRRRAHALWMVSWPFFAVVALVLALAVMVEPQTLARRATTVTAVGILVAILHAISRRGRPTLASWVLVLGLTVIVTQRAWITGGIHAPVAVFYAIFIVMGGTLLGARGGVVTALTSIAGAIVLTVGESMHWLAVKPNAGPPLAGFVFVLLAIGLALLVQTMINAVRAPRLGAEAVQMLVHDMRSPLHVVLAHLDLLRRETRVDGMEHVEGAIGGATAINRMATNLLDVSRLESGRLLVHKVEVDLVTLAHEVVESFRVLQPGRGIVVLGRSEALCNCDLELMRRVLENLVSNAIKHGPQYGSVLVVLSKSAGIVRLTVQDEGPGIPPERREAIFEPFNAKALRTRGYESSGLGLTFCRLAVHAQGGTIRVHDAHPCGTAFVVELPA
jgi:signal transduction histidine kinase